MQLTNPVTAPIIGSCSSNIQSTKPTTQAGYQIIGVIGELRGNALRTYRLDHIVVTIISIRLTIPIWQGHFYQIVVGIVIIFGFVLLQVYHADEIAVGVVVIAILHTFVERIEIGEKILPEGRKVAGPRTPYRQSIRIFYRFIGEASGDSLRQVQANRDREETAGAAGAF